MTPNYRELSRTTSQLMQSDGKDLILRMGEAISLAVHRGYTLAKDEDSAKVHLIDTISANVSNDKLTDIQFREFVKRALSVLGTTNADTHSKA